MIPIIARFIAVLLAIPAVWVPCLYADDFIEQMQRQNEIDSLDQNIRDTKAAHFTSHWFEPIQAQLIFDFRPKCAAFDSPFRFGRCAL